MELNNLSNNGLLQNMAQSMIDIEQTMEQVAENTSVAGSGEVTVTNFPETQPISGSVSVSNFPLTQNVNTGLTQPLTDAQLRASAVQVSIIPNSGTGGYTRTRTVISTANNNATAVYNQPTILNNIQLAAQSNLVTQYAYFKIFDKATSPVLGTDVPKAIFMLQSGSICPVNNLNLRLVNGLVYAITRSASLLATDAISAGEVVGTLTYL